MRLKKSITVLLTVLVLLQGYGLTAAEGAETGKQNVSEEKKAGESKKDKVDNKGTIPGKEKEKNLELKKEDGPATPFWRSTTRDLGTVLASPFHMKKKNTWKWLSVAAITGVLIATDESTYKEIKRFQAKNKWVDDVGPHVTKLGLGEWNLGIAGAFYVGGLLFKDKRARETARLTVMTFIHTSVAVQIGKHILGRQRPSQQDGKDYWHGPEGFFKRYKKYQLANYDAFPSGHTISIFGTATVVAEMYKDTVWVPIVSYTLATACGLSRITEDTHWLSDVFLGAVMGIVIGKFVVKKRNRMGMENKKITVTPVAHSGKLGIGLTYTF